MKKLKVALVVLVGLVVGVVLGGYAIDPDVTLETDATLAAPPEVVFDTLNTYEGQVRWWTEAVKAYADQGMGAMQVEVLDGPRSGAGMKLEFLYDGTVAEEWEILLSDAPRRIKVRVDFQIFVVERTLTLSAAGGGTAVHWSDVGHFGNPLMRYMTLMPSDEVIGNFDRALTALDRVTAPGTP